MIRQLVFRGLVGTAAAAVVAGMIASPVRADEPLQQGWWTVANPGLPTLPAQPPSDVPADGLLVQGGPSGPTAYAALVYGVDARASVGQLILTVAPSSATTPGAELDACPLDDISIVPAQGGPMSSAPAYTCTRKATASASADGKSYTFSVSSLVANGTLAVAILPTDPTNRVVFSKPGPSSLVVTEPESEPTSSPVDTGGDTPTQPTEPTTVDSGSFSGQPPVQSTSSGPAPTEPQPAPEVAPTPAATGTQAAAAGSTTEGDDHSTPATVGLMLGGLIFAAALWAFAGRHPSTDVAEETS